MASRPGPQGAPASKDGAVRSMTLLRSRSGRDPGQAPTAVERRSSGLMSDLDDRCFARLARRGNAGARTGIELPNMPLRLIIRLPSTNRWEPWSAGSPWCDGRRDDQPIPTTHRAEAGGDTSPRSRRPRRGTDGGLLEVSTSKSIGSPAIRCIPGCQVFQMKSVAIRWTLSAINGFRGLTMRSGVCHFSWLDRHP